MFVACGAVSSTRLMLESMGRPQRTRRLCDSQYFVIPMLTPRVVPVTVATQGNTLAQLFVELQDERVSRHAAHLQLYGYNDLMLAAARGAPAAAGGEARADAAAAARATDRDPGLPALGGTPRV